MGERTFDWRAFVRRPRAVLAVWLAYSAVRLAIQPLLGWEPDSPDDWARLLQVRAWLEGQAFQDVTQYRMNPPHGFSMHWSRLVDLPLAALMLAFGETAALALVPLVWLLPALFAVRSIMLRLGFPDLAFSCGLVLLPLFPLLPGLFAPFAIDHHAPQAVLAIVCAALLIHDSRASALACGLCAATWVVISLEGLPLVAVLAALYGVRYGFGERTLLPWFLGALAACSAALSYLTRGPVEAAFCDVLLPGHITSFALAAAIAAVIPALPGQDRAHGRFVALAAMGTFVLFVAAAALGPCAGNPMADLDPVLQTYWHDYITEGLPIWEQPISTAMMLVWTVAIIAAGWWRAHRAGLFHQGRALPCTVYFLFALSAGGYSLLVMREGAVAQVLAIPFAALLMGEFLPKARSIAAPVPRILATLAAVGLTTPMLASAIGKPLDRSFPTDTMRTLASVKPVGGTCDYSMLEGLEPGLVFAPLDAGPEILGRTPHTVVAANYHRNQRAMADVIMAFGGSSAMAVDTIQSYGADWVVACASASDLTLYRSIDPGSFANALLEGPEPAGLERVSAFDRSPLRVFRVIRPVGNPAPRH